MSMARKLAKPKQFDDEADLRAYPRVLERDLELAQNAEMDLVWAPPQQEVYPPAFATAVDVGELGSRWEGVARPGHFQGVATVVTNRRSPPFCQVRRTGQ